MVPREPVGNPDGMNSSSNTRTSQYRFLCLVQRGESLPAGHCRKVEEEVGKGMSCFDVVHHGLEGNPRSEKHRGAAENIRIAVNQDALYALGSIAMA
jgi:hypothetical protein